MFRKSVFTAILACATFAGLLGAAAEDPSTVFKKLAGYISAHPLDFETSFSSRSAILDTGLINGRARIIAAQPNRLRLDTTGSKGSFLVVSDGTTLTVLNRKSNTYAQTPAPDSLGATVNLFTGLLALEPQTLLFMDAVQDVASGQGKVQAASSKAETIGGRTCQRYAVAGSEGATWEAWLETKDIPLPCKLISRDGDDPAAAVQTNEFTWTANAAPAADTFKFTPPAADTFKFTPPEASKLVDFGDLGMSD